MFEFEYVELMNWAYWPTVKLPMDQRTIMITGPNGSGKTTFLDALRTLLRAPRMSANRRYTDYLIGNVGTAVIKAVVTNRERGGEKRPFEFKGFLSEKVTLAVFMHKRSGRWERRYTIVEGDISLKELQTIPKSHLLSPETYTREISEAGFSSAFLKVLALEQGQTDKLCEKSPRELLDLLLEVHGDKQIIERYQKARTNYHSANLELSQLGARLAEENAKVVASERQANAYKRYRQLCKELKEYEEVLIPQAEYAQAQEEIQEIRFQINEINQQLGPVDRAILDLQDQLDNADADLNRRKIELEQARGLKIEMDEKERELDIRLNNIMHEKAQLKEQVGALEPGSEIDIKKLREERSTLRREIIKLELKQDDFSERASELRREMQDFDQPERKVYPRFVEEFTRVLKREGLDFDLVCDLIDIKDKDWQLAVESIIGRDRFTILVDEDDVLAVRKLGQQHRYRCYVVARQNQTLSNQSAPHASALSVVDILDPSMPKWITDNLQHVTLVEDVADGMRLKGKTTVTRKGYRQDRRGGISIAADRFYCGSLGQSSLKNELEQQLSSIKSQLGQVNKELQIKRDEDAGKAKAIQAFEQKDQVAVAMDRLAELDLELPKVNKEHKQFLELKHQAEQKLLDKLESYNNFERDSNDLRKQLLERRNAQSETFTELQDLQKQIEELQSKQTKIAAKLDAELISENALANVEDLDELTPRLYTVRRLLAEYETPPDEGAVEVYEHHKAQYEHQRELYESHEEGLRKWEGEFQLARQKYIIVVEHTIREYRRNVLALAEIAGVRCEIVMPNLRDAENLLEQTELVVRFGFDGKSTTNMDGSSLSGGQRVVASLVLLMSLATSGGVNAGGFFIIDEPFAHLSLERIDDVARFLDKSRCQFILTSPTTHNVNVFSAARLQMNFRIKRPGEKFAPIPTLISRGDENEVDLLTDT